MASRLQWSVYGGSIVAHVALAFAVERVEARPPTPPIPVAITVTEIPPEPPPPPDPPKPPETPPPQEAEPIEAPELEAPPPEPPKPKPKAPKPAASASSTSSAPVPTFGMSGGSTGTAVPTGSPDGERGEDDEPAPAPKKTVKKAKVLDAPKAESADTCAEEDTKPKPISMPQPEYTDAARAAGIAGKVRVQVSIDASGKVEKVTVIGPLDPGLDKAAIAAIEKATFEPATKCGKPVAATFKISVKFTL